MWSKLARRTISKGSPLDETIRGITVALIVVLTVVASGCASELGNKEPRVGTKSRGQKIERQETGRIYPPTEVNVLAPNDEYSVASGKPLYRVWYGTNRKPVDEKNLAKGFSESEDQVLHYGNAYVYVPKSHEFGSVGSSWIVRTFTRTDDLLKLERIQPLDEAQFIRELQLSLKKKDPGHRKALIYIHGYNVTFENALIRAAQIGFDLKVEGVTTVYSWPSMGTLYGYTADEDSVESSEHLLEEFLARVALESEAEEIDVIAHSMGNRAFLHAVNKLEPVMRKAGKKFGQIFLAAPDVNVNVFKRLASIYPNISKRTTLYVSSKDIALKGSGFLHQSDRAGFYPPITTLSGIDTVQVSNVDLTLLGHSYFSNAEAVLHDMFDLLRSNLAPYERKRLHPHPSDTMPEYWEIGP